MENIERKPSTSLRPLVLTWLLLVGLTLVSPQLGAGFGGDHAVQLVVAAIIWFKGSLVARHFIEAELAHPFIRNVLRIFIAFAPIAIVLTTFFGDSFARFASL
ncbi:MULTISPECIES: hypothetical protein [Thauera]|uniref:Uncharacterized protein n=1 Tax=Thauera aromatica K172 TaxID=44139 RepID=A0A2R4BM04_THAAR|nr:MULTISPECIES: hypothetical protein [Thauera]AVR88345.1 hypothetical protein Tharo_1420 [Thauera aromatica K172]KIN91758.1 putative membrane protein [Thauera sp. SWB20]